MKTLFFFSPRRSLFRFIFALLGGIFLLFAWWQSLFSNPDRSVILLIDNSLSMVVQDISQRDSSTILSRLDAAKRFSTQFVEKFSGEIAISSFSREITIESPFSDDKNFLKNVISGISPIIYGGGSDIFGSMQRIAEIYQNRSNTEIIVLTDAEFFEKPTNFSFSNRIKITFVAIGTEQGGLMLQ